MAAPTSSAIPAAGEASKVEPIPAEWSALRGRDAYLSENGFTAAAYDAPTTQASLLGVRFSVPNTRRHRTAIRLHDLHHVATGYGTDLVGEAEISAWELRRGLRGVGLYVGTIVTSLALLGVVIAPRRTIRAWRASAPRGSLFQATTPYDTLLQMSVGELRESLEVSPGGVARTPRRLHPHAPTSP